MRVLVTGCAGFIGSHLTEKLLNEGYEVIGVDCFTDYYSRRIKESNMESFADQIEFLEKDILEIDISIIKKIDVIFHLAAQAGVRASWGDEFEVYTRHNILTTQRLLEACRKYGIGKFVYASSSSVYGNMSKLPMREDMYPRPFSPYGVTKLAAENLCELYRMNYGIKTISLRYFTVYGERQRPDMAFHKFIKAILNDEEIVVYGDGKQTRDFTYVGDVVDATIKAAESEAVGVFNIGGGTRIPLIEVVKLLEEIMGREANIRFEEPKKGDVRDTYADISKAREILKFEPKVELKKGLKEEIKWIQEIYASESV
jgi:UDP-glucose 4-epimerase